MFRGRFFLEERFNHTEKIELVTFEDLRRIIPVNYCVLVHNVILLVMIAYACVACKRTINQTWALQVCCCIDFIHRKRSLKVKIKS